ncbi:MAG: iron-sulfur cluster repair di-iron protein [Planctomycetaceae bacterium]|nr:iron-sulfur cluster repair di-iron protein [Planctomycetaceae bacterium]
MSTLDTSSTVAQWVSKFPQTSRLFEQLQIDYCCGGGVVLADVCERQKLDANAILTQLEDAIAHPQHESTENWSDSGLCELCDHIQQTHHAYLRKELPRLTELVDKVASAHGANHPKLGGLQEVFAALRAELEPHMFKEEQILSPAIRQMEEAASSPHFPFGTVANPIRMMEHEHDNAGNALARIRELTDDFLLPDDACNTYRVMLDSLRQLEGDLHQHIHKENNILFPRARALESSLDKMGT